MEKSLQPSQQERENSGHFLALLPFFVFVLFYLGLSIIARNFYRVPMIVAFLVASSVALMQNRKMSFAEKVEAYAAGMGNVDIMIMCLIFILAGAFATVAKGMGAVDAAVALAQHIIPARLMLVGMFLVSCFISLAIGTSCGTIAALTPIAVGLVESMNCAPELLIGAVIGGAMFGDNMSMISDTTIAATRTQGVAMRDKFIANFWLVLPAALIVILVYLLRGSEAKIAAVAPFSWRQLIAVIPYIAVLIFALLGVNVMLLLFLGTVLAGIIGRLNGTLTYWQMLDLSGSGTLGMSETLIVALLAGGLLNCIRNNGGISFLMRCICSRIHSRSACEVGIVFLVAVVNLFTANNTVAIVIAGPLARELSEKYHCSGKRVAGLLDAASCAVQGMIPYGAQMLIALGIVQAAGLKLSPFKLLISLYYPILMLVSLLFSILLQRKKER